MYKNNDLYNNHTHCLLVYDIEKREFIYKNNDHLFFTPASNIKILTCLASIKLLKKKIIFGYLKKENNGKCLLKPLGDPSFLNPIFNDNKAVQFINRNCYALSIIDNYPLIPYGAGWAWDDMQEEYSLQRSLLPIYGNIILSIKDTQNTHLDNNNLVSRYFSPKITNDSLNFKFLKQTPKKRGMKKHYFDQNNKIFKNDTIKIPLITNRKFFSQLLADTLKLPIQNIHLPFYAKDSSWHTIQSVMRDEVIKIMMIESDNFLAEQLLIQIGEVNWGTHVSKEIISMIKDKKILPLNENSQWVDASGLSRYNLLSPIDLISTLELIEKEKGMLWVKNHFAVGGKSGTLKNWEENGKHPYIYAKTGTLKNVYNITGYIETKSNKKLIFCQLNNQKIVANDKLTKQIQKTLSYLYHHY